MKKSIIKYYLGVDLENNDLAKGYDLEDLEDLEKVMKMVRHSIIRKHIANGVIFKDLDGVHIDANAKIGQGTQIYANNYIRGNTIIGKECILEAGNIIENATIGDNVRITCSNLENCEVGSQTTVGPNAHIHTHSVVGSGCRVGNYVEIKNSTMGMGTKAAHLAYVGDVDIGSNCNIGCGAIFINYDGKNKHRSLIGNSVFIGSNSNVVAPVKIEDNAYIAAGTTVTVNLPRNCMCIGRSRETVKENRSKYNKPQYVKKYFGTDGIRGEYGKEITENIAFLCGNRLGYSSDGGTVVVGRDNRPSGKAIADALIEGITTAGANVIDLGIVTTPNVAFTTVENKANYGVAITASHNPWQYNGIKVFDYNGRKLENIEEIEIEKHIDEGKTYEAQFKGSVEDGKHYIQEYVDDLCNLIGNLKGLNVVLDCSNGASSKTASKIFERLGANVRAYNTEEDGHLINEGCGALHPEFIVSKVLEQKADIGLCFDGDADRVIAVDSKGKKVDGDSIIYIIGRELKEQGRLTNNAVVGTLHTNMGVEQSLAKLGIRLERTDIGDHFVVERMLKEDLLVGGEQSGHIILREFSNTGDGILAGLYLSKLIKEKGVALCDLDDSEHYPQENINIITDKKKEIMASEEVQAFAKELEEELGNKGRILLRASGTEPKIRIMVECQDKELAQKEAIRIKEFIESRFGIK
ncbi:MAG: phosphoglucosamine mutase [Clostridiales bacterium]|nr:phosphoglucosamine mutase [Clostridiales bacterium]